MKRIKIEKWNVTRTNPKTGKEEKVTDQNTGKPIEESLLIMVNALINSRDPQKLPRGIDQFRLFSKVATAFEKADKSGMLELEDAQYSFLKKMVTEDIPSVWGTNQKYAKAVEAFMDAENQTEKDIKPVEKEIA